MSEAVHGEVEVAAGRGGLLPRLGSVLALAPLGVWTVWHLWENLYVWAGREAWAAHVTDVRVVDGTSTYVGNGVSSWLVSLVVLGPLVLHTLWGLRRIRMTKPNGYKFFGNAKYLLQRLSALGLMGFLGAHIFLARIKPALGNPTGHEEFCDLAGHMRHHPPTLVVYTLGVIGIAYHLANGVYTAAFINGLAASPKASRQMQVISLTLFAVLLVFGLGSVIGMYQQAEVFSCPVPLD
ncbi:MAG: hypothetical protein R3A48_18080 [Polyangiales bacterium]